MAVVLAISGRPPFEVDADTITIGSDAGSRLAFPGDERVRPRHAVIRQVAGRWLVEAREADSIQVGNSEPARVHWLKPGDLIRLGEKGPEITFQPQAGSPQVAAAPSRPPAKGSSPPPFSMDPVELKELKPAPVRNPVPHVKPLPAPRENKTPAAAPPKGRKISPVLAIAGGVAAVAVLAVAVWIGFGRGGGEDQPKKSPSHAETGDPPVAKKRKKNGSDGGPTTAVAAQEPQESPAGKPPPVSADPTALPDAPSALYAVLVRDGANRRQFRLGTAWAVAPRQLVTSGAVVMAIEELQKSGLTAVVVPAGEVQQIRVTGMRVHPVYRQAVQDASAARQKLEKADPADESADGRETEDSPDDPAQSPRETLARAYSSQADFDVGVLGVNNRLEHLLKPLFSAPWQAEARCVLAGLPFKVDEYEATDPGPANRMEQHAGSAAPGTEGKSDGLRLTLDLSGDVGGRNWSGSPVLNRAGAVVGVYSRPLEDATGRDSRDADRRTSHAVTPIDRLREIAPDLK